MSSEMAIFLNHSTFWFKIVLEQGIGTSVDGKVLPQRDDVEGGLRGCWDDSNKWGVPT